MWNGLSVYIFKIRTITATYSTDIVENWPSEESVLGLLFKGGSYTY